MSITDIKIQTYRYGKYVEPFLILFILTMLVLPMLSVTNLSARFKPEPTKEKTDVLGASESTVLSAKAITGTHSVITQEQHNNENNQILTYSATLAPHNKGDYSKPIFELTNNSEEKMILNVISGDESSSSTQLGLIYNDKVYVLKDSEGNIYTHQLIIEPGVVKTLYLHTTSKQNVNFAQYISVKVIVQPSNQ